MDLADEISYSLHDLEDAISLGMVTREMWMEHFSEHETLFTNCHGKIFSETCQSVADSLLVKVTREKSASGCWFT